MFTQEDVEKNYYLGSKTMRIYDGLDLSKPDIFELLDKSARFVYDNKHREVLSDYFDMAFANYWKRGVEKILKMENKRINPDSIKKAMTESLNSLNQLAIDITNFNGYAILYSKLQNKRGATDIYWKMFTNTISRNASAFATFIDAIAKNANFDYKLTNLEFAENGVIAYKVEKSNEPLIHKDIQSNRLAQPNKKQEENSKYLNIEKPFADANDDFANSFAETESAE